MTLLISLTSLLVVWAIAIPVAVISATNQYSLFDYTATFSGFVGLAMPTFVLALVLGWVLYKATGLKITGLFAPNDADFLLRPRPFLGGGAARASGQAARHGLARA